MMMQMKAPWTDEQVAMLNHYQTNGQFHPFTCGVCRDEIGTSDGPGHFDDRYLVAYNDGWHCRTCSYTQDWAYEAMLRDV